MKLHPLCSLFPPMNGEDYMRLKASIQASGLNEPITMWNGQILDGRNRYKACRELGVEVKTKEFEGTENEAIGYVFDANLARRHLTTGQKAMIASELATATVGNPLKKGDTTVPKAAALLGVSKGSVEQAKALKVGAVVKAVKEGAITLGAGVTLEKSVSGEVLEGMNTVSLKEFAKTLGKGDKAVCNKAVRLAQEFSTAFIELRKLPVGESVEQAIADCRVWLSRCN